MRWCSTIRVGSTHPNQSAQHHEGGEPAPTPSCVCICRDACKGLQLLQQRLGLNQAHLHKLAQEPKLAHTRDHVRQAA